MFKLHKPLYINGLHKGLDHSNTFLENSAILVVSPPCSLPRHYQDLQELTWKPNFTGGKSLLIFKQGRMGLLY